MTCGRRNTFATSRPGTDGRTDGQTDGLRIPGFAGQGRGAEGRESWGAEKGIEWGWMGGGGHEIGKAN